MAAEEINLYKFMPPGGIQNDLVDKLNAGTNGTTLTVTRMISHVTGTSAAVATITPPWTDFSGPIYLIADSAWAIVATGNINNTLTAAAGVAYGFVYDRKTSKWYRVG
jgi:hypothetical protein